MNLKRCIFEEPNGQICQEQWRIVLKPSLKGTKAVTPHKCPPKKRRATQWQMNASTRIESDCRRNTKPCVPVLTNAVSNKNPKASVLHYFHHYNDSKSKRRTKPNVLADKTMGSASQRGKRNNMNDKSLFHQDSQPQRNKGVGRTSQQGRRVPGEKQSLGSCQRSLIDGQCRRGRVLQQKPHLGLFFKKVKNTERRGQQQQRRPVKRFQRRSNERPPNWMPNGDSWTSRNKERNK